MLLSFVDTGKLIVLNNVMGRQLAILAHANFSGGGEMPGGFSKFQGGLVASLTTPDSRLPPREPSVLFMMPAGHVTN